APVRGGFRSLLERGQVLRVGDRCVAVDVVRADFESLCEGRRGWAVVGRAGLLGFGAIAGIVPRRTQFFGLPRGYGNDQHRNRYGPPPRGFPPLVWFRAKLGV